MFNTSGDVLRRLKYVFHNIFFAHTQYIPDHIQGQPYDDHDHDHVIDHDHDHDHDLLDWIGLHCIALQWIGLERIGFWIGFWIDDDDDDDDT